MRSFSAELRFIISIASAMRTHGTAANSDHVGVWEE
jgi:hypothetical protein